MATKTNRWRSTLPELRRVLGKTQIEVAAAGGFHQGDLSKLERREDLGDVTLNTLRRYVEALGGELRLVAVVRGKEVELRGAD
jgi:transcriptional regulator with XRE-family HTH domain